VSLLCVIPGCRIRGRHLPACEDGKCDGCLPRQTENGYSCARCASLAAQNLESVAEVALAVSDAANRLSSGSGGGGPGKPGSQLPLDLGARSRLDRVTASLNGWARHVAEERGVHLPEAPTPVTPPPGPLCRTRYECTHDSCKAMRDQEQAPPMLAVVARWLVGHLDWLAHRPEVDEVFADFAACARVLSGVVRAPRESRYLGPCGSTVGWDDDGNEYERDEPCKGSVFVPLGGGTGTCRTCKARWPADDRQKWLDGEVRAAAFTARDIADAHGVNVKTIRTWANRGQLASYWRTETGIVAAWTDPPDGETRERLHYVGDVLDLAAADKARLAGDQAKRARRKENAA